MRNCKLNRDQNLIDGQMAVQNWTLEPLWCNAIYGWTWFKFRSPIHKHCRKTCRKTCHKIIISHHLRCHKIILRHVVNEFTEFIFNDRNFFHEGVLLSWKLWSSASRCLDSAW